MFRGRSKLPEGANMRLWFPPAAVLATLGVIWTTTMGTCWLFQSMVSEVRLAPGMVHVLIGILGLTVGALCFKLLIILYAFEESNAFTYRDNRSKNCVFALCLSDFVLPNVFETAASDYRLRT